MANHYRIKQIPEDFRVIEIPKLVLCMTGPFTYFTLKKRRCSTLEAVSRVSRTLGIRSNIIRNAGNKDAHAITEQACSIKGDWSKDLLRLHIPDIEISILGHGDHPLQLGQLQRNQFCITAREIDCVPSPLPRFLNYFGSQRFGRNNPAIGRAIVKRDFQDAINLILESSPNLAEAIRLHLGQTPNDFIGALRTIPKTNCILFIHAYQSLLWNHTVQSLLAHGADYLMEVPLIGFDLSCSDPLLREILDSVLEREEIKPADFIFREMPELCAKGGGRKLFVDVNDLIMGSLEPNDLGPGFRCTFSFSLPPGSYATVFVDQLFGN